VYPAKRLEDFIVGALTALHLPEGDAGTCAARMTEADLRGALTQVRCPVLLVLGDHDALVPVSAAAAVRSLNPAISVAIISDAGHAPFLSHPSQFVDVIRRFLP